MESLEHLIVRSIKSYYKNRIYAPVIFLVLLILLALVFPIKAMISPGIYKAGQGEINLHDMYAQKQYYGHFILEDLYFTGYTSRWLDATRGYYYYTMIGDECVIVLLDPDTSSQGQSYIEKLAVRGKVLYESEAARSLLLRLAQDLNWSEEGILSTVSTYTISEPDATNVATRAFEFFYVSFVFYTCSVIVLYSIYIVFPVLSPPVRKTAAYGNPARILEEAEEELATLPQLATEDMFITEHYFIETSSFGVAIVPIDAIIWIYKYSTMHKFLWHHFSITYTLHITAGKRHYIKCPQNIKSDIDGIMDYLAEANHNILVGFSEENRLKVEEIQNDLGFVRTITKFLSKRI